MLLDKMFPNVTLTASWSVLSPAPAASRCSGSSPSLVDLPPLMKRRTATDGAEGRRIAEKPLHGDVSPRPQPQTTWKKWIDTSPTYSTFGCFSPDLIPQFQVLERE